ncbi:hypothetical protein HNQ77_004518 [Silvibacterium bohemicum]|uniref:Uncharacterized protein n=1 Tax=Silvibacterium bohemicum TaxID=1577686 RepID=A0A841K3M3_9BACT|nr:hypothetical protein [Silvibacterium bohemicum]MBB6146539.1 hypothetical protein [Silvibacterium bohemicum]
MPFRKLFALTAAIFCCVLAPAKDKKKNILPIDVLQARTVFVLIDPTAGVDAADPNANRLARMDVERALDAWGRFTLVQEGSTADLVIMVRKSNGQMVQPTIGGTPVNGNPPINGGSTSSPTQTTTRAGGHWGTSAIPNDPSSTGSQSAGPYPQIEAGATQDTFVVYRGNKDDPHWNPLDAPAVWRYSRKDALASPAVPAVEVFRKLIAESEKQLASNP